MSGVVTALIAQKKNKDRVSVFIDGEFAFGLSALEAARLRRGQALSAEEISALRAQDEIERAREKALNLLSYRPRSSAELARALRDKEFSAPAIEAALARLNDVGLVDDAAFARFWAENRSTFRPRSRRALRQELKLKGVAEEDIRDALEEIDEEEAAYQAVRNKAARLTKLDRAAFDRKLGGALARLGFGYEIIQVTLNRVWEEKEAAEDDPDAPPSTL